MGEGHSQTPGAAAGLSSGADLPPPAALLGKPAVAPCAQPRGAWKWWLAVVLFLATVLTYLDRQTMSLCGGMITREWGLSEEQFGDLLGGFRMAYALVQVPAGLLADHVPVRMTYALAVGVWSLAGAAAALVTGAKQMLFTRRLLGAGEAFNWPCATRIVATMLPPEDRGLASGIFTSGAAAGSLLAPLVITPLARAIGWRWAFFVIGALGAFWIGLWLFATRKGTAAHRVVGRVAHAAAGPRPRRGRLASLGTWSRQVLLHPAFWMLVLVALTVNPCWYFLNDWIPKYMIRAHHVGDVAAGFFTVPVFLAADAGNLASGGLIKLLTTRGWSLRKARGTTLALAAVVVLPVATVPRIDNPYLVVTLLALGGSGITSIVANYSACQQDFSFANVGLVAGILGMLANLAAAVIQPWIGRYVDLTGTYNLIFQLVAIVPVVSFIAILLFDAIIHGRKMVTD
jgi:ACS family hexuronate transporter-like MFS transporter